MHVVVKFWVKKEGPFPNTLEGPAGIFLVPGGPGRPGMSLKIHHQGARA